MHEKKGIQQVKSMPFIPKDSFLGLLEEETNVELTNPCLPGKNGH